MLTADSGCCSHQNKYTHAPPGRPAVAVNIQHKCEFLEVVQPHLPPPSGGVWLPHQLCEALALVLAQVAGTRVVLAEEEEVRGLNNLQPACAN